jgi:membrane-bound lytic murein transglycosylase MltF
VEAGKERIEILKADENLETDDILEMVDAGLAQITVADRHLLDFWRKIFKNLKDYESLVLRSGGEIGWAFRKDSPLLKETVNQFAKGHKRGTLVGNILINRYLGNTKHVENALAAHKVAELSKLQDLFRKYGNDYGFDWLLLAAQGYQESRLNQRLRSRRGAVGVMQILPSTASDPNVNIPNIDRVENNIHAGAKYLRFLADRYFSDGEPDPVNRHLFALAAYNAGPRRIVSARKQSTQHGLDPNSWFQNVEIMVARLVGRQPVDYVSNIYQYYISYRILLEQDDTKRLLRQKMESGS